MYTIFTWCWPLTLQFQYLLCLSSLFKFRDFFFFKCIYPAYIFCRILTVYAYENIYFAEFIQCFSYGSVFGLTSWNWIIYQGRAHPCRLNIFPSTTLTCSSSPMLEGLCDSVSTLLHPSHGIVICWSYLRNNRVEGLWFWLSLPCLEDVISHQESQSSDSFNHFPILLDILCALAAGLYCECNMFDVIYLTVGISTTCYFFPLFYTKKLL